MLLIGAVKDIHIQPPLPPSPGTLSYAALETKKMSDQMAGSPATAKRDAVLGFWPKRLSRRSRRRSLSWDYFNLLLKRYPLPAALVIHSVCRPLANP